MRSLEARTDAVRTKEEGHEEGPRSAALGETDRRVPGPGEPPGEYLGTLTRHRLIHARSHIPSDYSQNQSLLSGPAAAPRAVVPPVLWL